MSTRCQIYFLIAYKYLLIALGKGEKKELMDLCLVQLDGPLLLAQAVLAVVTSELSASV